MRRALVSAVLVTGCCPVSGVITGATNGAPTAGFGTASSAATAGGSASGSASTGGGTGTTTGRTATSGIGGGSSSATTSTSAGVGGSSGGSGSTGISGTGGASGASGSSGTAGSSGASSFSSLSLLAGQLGGQGWADGAGNGARFWGADAVAADGQGHVYVADTGSSTVRAVDLATGEVSTLAGTAAVSGAIDGTGPAARFEEPYGIAYDGRGNLFVADTINDTIRQIAVATGAVTTLAGMPQSQGSADGPASSATFWYPEGVAADGAGHVFVADTNNCTIREIDVASGTVSTLAGSAGSCGKADGTGPAASFILPVGVAADGAGNLYASDTGNQLIRKIVIASGAVTTLAGTGVTGSADGTGLAASFDYPQGLAWDGAGHLLVADGNNDAIRSVDVSSGAVTTLAGNPGVPGSSDGTGPAALFREPWGVGCDGAGTCFVADSYDDTVRQVVESTGTVTTVAGLAPHEGSADGTGAGASFFDPQGLAYDGSATLFVADAFNDTIRQVVVATGAVTTLAGAPGQQGSQDGTGNALFNSPHGVASDGAGDVYVADTGNCTIRKVALATGAVTTLAGDAGVSGHADGTGTAATFYEPWALAWGGGRALYVADAFNNVIRKVDVTSGAVTTLAGTPGTGGEADGSGPAAGFAGPAGLAWDGAGDLFVADSSGQTIREIVVATATVTTLAGTPNVHGSNDGTGPAALFNGPEGLAWDGAGHLFVSDVGNSTVREVDVASGAVTTVLGTPGRAGVVLGPAPGGLNWPIGLVYLNAGGVPELVVADSNENAILVAR